MKSHILLAGWIVLLSLAGCFTQEEAVKEAEPQPVVVAPKRKTPPPPPVEQPAESNVFAEARIWSPRFVATGLSSGIMIEFTGMKKDAPLNARFSGIEVWPYPVDTVAFAQHDSSALPQTLSETINNLRQAFYKIPPGMYLVRHTKEWADTSYIRDVEVREGEYSIISVGVLKPKQ